MRQLTQQKTYCSASKQPNVFLQVCGFHHYGKYLGGRVKLTTYADPVTISITEKSRVRMPLRF